VFEIGPKGKALNNKAAAVMRSMRSKVKPRKAYPEEDARMVEVEDMPGYNGKDDFADFGDEEGSEKDEPIIEVGEDSEDESESELEVTVTSSTKAKKGQTSYQDPKNFMSYTPRATNMAEERTYGVRSGSATNPSFIQAAQEAAMDLTNDERAKTFGQPTRARFRWDKKANKYVSRQDEDPSSRGGSSAKTIRGESGVKIAASFRSGRFDRWQRSQRLGRMPRVGESESRNLVHNFATVPGRPRYKHTSEKAPKDADIYRDDYHVRKRRVAEAKEKRVGKYADGEGSKREIKTAVDIRKARELQERRKAKNARPAKKKAKR